MIRDAVAADALRIAEIYNHYVLHTIVTFEEEPVAADEMARRMDEVRAASLPWIVSENAGRILGFAYASKWKGRCAYRFSTEVTVYLDPESGGRGLGSTLYGKLFPMLAERNVHVALGGIALPNPASIALHEKFGMKKVAHLEEVGFKFGAWIDVGYWQRTLPPR
jgi:L-amino acid N-acyltransferase YncA